MNCELAHDLAGAFALDALSDEERGEFEAHIATCADHAEELAWHRRVSRGLAASAEAMPPPPGLRSRILESVEGRPGSAQGAVPTPIRRREPGSGGMGFRLPYALAAVFALIALGMLAWNITLLSGGDQAQPGDETFAFSGPGGSGDVTFVPDKGVAVVNLAGLANLPEDQDYQVWVIEGGSPRSLGLLTVESGQATFAALAATSGIDAIAVTIEPAGGSPAPTSDPILTAEV